ncbi:hypothetical protein GCM10010275_56590 [Streptomyces litmocidini]|uniref:hypothetical protein n=1 Tax=Streptomyces litmocidini TaxID=67318 RepID=UPI00167D7479|nr:hypothetical protein [Streptomyces litmocidini]GGV08776.1 hypothetical protein GCM10010275_56590 [Streptomyces litmocidini]
MGAADERDLENGEGWLTKAEVREIWPQIRPSSIRAVARANSVRTSAVPFTDLTQEPTYHAADVRHVAARIARGEAEVAPWQRADSDAARDDATPGPPVPQPVGWGPENVPGLILLAIIVGLFLWGLASPDNHGTVTGFVR